MEIKGLKFKTREKSTDINIINEVVGSDNYLSDNIKPGDVVIDIGAHIGSFSVLAASLGAVVYSYEPFSSSFNLLRENLKLNNLPEHIHQLAVTATPGERTIFIRPINFGGSNLYHPNNDETYQEKIFCINMEDVFKLDNIKSCDFLKLDCEGSELEILQSVPDLSIFKIIAVEYDELQEDDRRNKLLELLKPTHNIIKDTHNPTFGTIIAVKI